MLDLERVAAKPQLRFRLPLAPAQAGKEGQLDNEHFDDFGHAKAHGITSRGDHGKYFGRRTRLEELPQRESFRKGRAGWSRHFRLNLPAIDHIIQGGIGRPWGKVYSEIVAKIKENFSEDCWPELFERVRWSIELNPMDVGDGQYVQATGRPFYEHSRLSTVMVHPVTGLLIRPKKEWCKITFERPGARRGWWDEETHYWQGLYFRKMHGEWHEVELAIVPKRPQNHQNHSQNRGRYPWYAVRDSDWLYQMNLRDVVIRTRIHSDLRHDLARCHGYKKYDGTIISHKQYQEELSKALKSNWYSGCVSTPMLCERYVYAKSAWPISKARMRQVGIPVGPVLTAPNIVR